MIRSAKLPDEAKLIQAAADKPCEVFSQRSQTGAQNGGAYPSFGVNTARIRFAIIVRGRNGLLQQAAIELIEPSVQARELVQQKLWTCAFPVAGVESLLLDTCAAAPVKGRFSTP